MTRPTRLRGEQGQIVMPLLALVLVLFACALGMFAFAEASDSRGKAQKAADAAALGAAASARDTMVASLLTPTGGAAFHGDFSALANVSGAAATGCASATSWARRNSSSMLTGCRYQPPDRFAVSTRSLPSPQRKLQGTASATADLNAPACQLSFYTTTGGDYHEVVTCVGRGGTAFVDYLVEGYEVTAHSPDTAWKQTFRVRLVD